MTQTKRLSMVKLSTDRGRYATDDRRLREADLVIDHKGTVIMDRYGVASRAATITEVKNSTEIKP